jgi:nitroreductase
MDILQAMSERKSCRAFSDSPIDREQLRSVLDYALKAPSAINMQPWEPHLVIGEELRRLGRRLLKSYRERSVGCGPNASKPIPEKFLERGRDSSDELERLIKEMGSEFGVYINEGSLDFYQAPAAALVFLDDSFPFERMADVGIFAAYTLLSAQAHGLRTCPIGLITAYEDEIKDQLNIEESKRLVLGIAIGEAKQGAPINEFRSPRASVDETTRWVD